ncbi:type I secretion system permease/ATPase [Sphaerotilus uruguayifluvii]|uniref:ATP-binding cassette subfamily C protein LapB n=1 Tax=Sphaerotilus uruguayifluvii TaxID=2735897 RepID=A0ABX2G7Q1_9BURK|nr:type I secretion system permease/ATPase [Leptothrix sp. C29]NRT58352.1 ATP-binding cassette subfamily C protein LapB [Leptothrix sp. C29]
MNAAAPSGQAAAGSADALLDAVQALCRHHGIERSAASLLDGLGLERPLTPAGACRVLEHAGLQAGRVRRDATEVLALLLPVLLPLRDGRAALLTARRVDADGRRMHELRVFDGAAAAPAPLQLDDAGLQALHDGDLLLAGPGDAASVPSAGRGADAPAEALEVHWFWRVLRRYLPYYRGAMLAALLSNVLMLFSGLFASVVYDRVIPHQAMVTLWSLAAGAVLATLFDLVARQLRSHLIDHAGRKADLALGSVLLRQSLGLRLEHRPESAGSFAHHMAQLEVVREFSTSASMSAISDLPFIVLFIAATWMMAGPLALVLVIAVPVILLLTVGVQTLMRRSMLAQQHQLADMQGLLVEAMDGIETIRAAGAQGFFQHRYEHANALAAQSALRARALSSWVNNVSMVSQQIVTIVMLVWGVHLIHDSQLSGGALISAVMFAGRAVAPLGSVVALASRYQGARAALRMLDRLMALPVEREPGRRFLPCPRLDGQLALREAGFAYGPAGQAPQVLSNVTLRIAAGERVALLGRIGSGKSTVLRLLAGLYQPASGAVEIDGLDLRQLDPADFRRHIGFVEQEPRLFRGTVRENLLLGREAGADRIAEVLRLTGLERVVAAHPMGLDMPVGEGGAMLSGGQRQLVALARALLMRPQVLLMDEPTSSMDAQTEAQFVAQLRQALPRCTLVVVTHRPAMLELVERIAVLDAGRLIADGPKQAVLQALAGTRPPAPAASAAPAAGPRAEALC